MTGEAYTSDEMRGIFLSQIRVLVSHWAKGDSERRDAAEGMAHSILCMIDGVSGGFPCALDLVARPHPDDKQFNIGRGAKYVEDGQVINEPYLHELLYAKG